MRFKTSFEIMNVVAQRFFDAYLRNERPMSFEFAEFQELSVRTNDIEVSTE